MQILHNRRILFKIRPISYLQPDDTTICSRVVGWGRIQLIHQFLCNLVWMNCSFIIGKFSQGKSTNLSAQIKLHNVKKSLIWICFWAKPGNLQVFCQPLNPVNHPRLVFCIFFKFVKAARSRGVQIHSQEFFTDIEHTTYQY